MFRSEERDCGGCDHRKCIWHMELFPPKGLPKILPWWGVLQFFRLSLHYAHFGSWANMVMEASLVPSEICCVWVTLEGSLPWGHMLPQARIHCPGWLCPQNWVCVLGLCMTPYQPIFWRCLLWTALSYWWTKAYPIGKKSIVALSILKPRAQTFPCDRQTLVSEGTVLDSRPNQIFGFVFYRLNIFCTQ